MNHAERCESVRHCRWVDEIVSDAPWVIDQTFLDKHQIDFVAHDEDPYKGSDGSDDVYGFCKAIGEYCLSKLPVRFLRDTQAASFQLDGRLVFLRQSFWSASLPATWKGSGILNSSKSVIPNWQVGRLVGPPADRNPAWKVPGHQSVRRRYLLSIQEEEVKRPKAFKSQIA